MANRMGALHSSLCLHVNGLFAVHVTHYVDRVVEPVDMLMHLLGASAFQTEHV